jgi:enolase-phosphatase E1
MISGWFDTEVGGKRDADSYRRIATQIGAPAGEILFLSDVVEELDAAREAGMRTQLIDRPQDYPQPRLDAAANGHPRATAFDAIDLPH